MQILSDDRKDVPVTVTLKAETLMHFLAAATAMPQIPASECVKIKDAITKALNI